MYLSEICSSEDAFNEALPPHQEALRKSWYAYNLKFNPAPQIQTNQERRRRNMIFIWFNPLLNRNVQANIGRAFINLIDKIMFPNWSQIVKSLQ